MAQNRDRPTLAQRTRASVLHRNTHKISASDENAAPSNTLPAAVAAGKNASALAGGAQRVARMPLAQKQVDVAAAGGITKAAGRRALGDVSNKEKGGVSSNVEGKKPAPTKETTRPRSSTITTTALTRVPLRPVSNPIPARSTRSTSISQPIVPSDSTKPSPALPPAPRIPQLPLPGAIDYPGPASRVLNDLEIVFEAQLAAQAAADEEEDELEEDETGDEDEDMMDLDDEIVHTAEIVTSKSEPMLPASDAFESTAHPSSSSGAEEAQAVARELRPSATADFSSDGEEEEDESARDWIALPSREHRKVMAELDRVRRVVEEEVDPMDTTMVAEYTEEIFEYMRDLECSVMPSPTYMSAQSEIEWSMRTTLVDWLLQVHLRYHMLPETLWIAINIVDRFLSARVVSLVKLQLVGVTAMFIAAKYEEILAPSVDEFVFMTESGYTKDEILKGERIVLQTLDFKISNYCSPYSWVRRISKADDYDIHTRTLSKFLMEVTLLDERFLRARPSMVAGVGMYLARRMLGQDWDDLFTFYSSYTELQLLPGAKFIVDRLRSQEFEQFYVCKKYATKRFLKASVFAREWARKHGEEIAWAVGGTSTAGGEGRLVGDDGVEAPREGGKEKGERKRVAS